MDLADAMRLHARWTADLTPAQFQRVTGDLALQQVPAGATVCTKGEPVDAWVGVLDGLVKLTTAGADGKSLSFTGVPAGGWFDSPSGRRASGFRGSPSRSPTSALQAVQMPVRVRRAD